MNRTTLTLPFDIVSELMALVNARSKTEAVVTAIRDEIKKRKLEQIKSMAGKIDFIVEADELRRGDHRLG
ncbi:MAG TPA: DUF2191 domain-containing protein [Desulfuromonadales bacterium]|nr:DUF2191 domain-containing protein [Desulfuromonadales bacterium]